MTALYTTREKIEGLLRNDPFVTTIHRGQEDDFLTQKTDFYPAVRVDFGDVNNVSNEAVSIHTFVTILGNVDEDFGNEDFVLSTTMTIGTRLVANLQEAVHDANFELNINPTFSRLIEYGDNNLAGYGIELEIMTPNTSHNG